jgi:hypothetical protein
MKSKMTRKYVIIGEILISPAIIIPLVSLLTPYNLMENSLISYGMISSMFAFVGVDIYGMYSASKLNKKRGITK